MVRARRSTSSFQSKSSEPKPPVDTRIRSAMTDPNPPESSKPPLRRSTARTASSITVPPASSVRRVCAATSRRGLMWPAGAPSNAMSSPLSIATPVSLRTQSGSTRWASLPQCSARSTQSAASGYETSTPRGVWNPMPERASMSAYRAQAWAATSVHIALRPAMRVMRPWS